MTGVLLALAASGAWGVSDFVAGVRARDLALPVVLLLSQVAGLLMLLAAISGGVAAANGGHAGGSAFALSGVTMVTAAVAGAAGAGALGLLYLAMARAGIAVVAPIAAGAAAVPVLVGLIAGESLTARSWAGIGLALAGTLCAALPPRARSTPITARAAVAVGRADRRTAALAGVGSALCSGVFFVLLRRAADAGDPVAVTLANRASACALVAAWALGRWPELAGVRRARPVALLAVALVGVGDAVAELCFAAASTRAPLGVATSLSSLYPAVAILLALVLLGERVRPVGAAGIGFALVSVVLLGAG